MPNDVHGVNDGTRAREKSVGYPISDPIVAETIASWCLGGIDHDQELGYPQLCYVQLAGREMQACNTNYKNLQESIFACFVCAYNLYHMHVLSLLFEHLCYHESDLRRRSAEVSVYY